MIIEKEVYDKMPKELQQFFNVIRDEVMEEFDKAGNRKGMSGGGGSGIPFTDIPNGLENKIDCNKSIRNDEGSAARFFFNTSEEQPTPFIYVSKASGKEKNAGCETLPSGCTHPTVKPLKLMTYLINMITPPDGIVLDPFLGSGSTGVAAVQNGFSFIGIEKEPDYMEIAKARIEYAKNPPEK